MGRYLFRRAWQSLITLIVVVVLVFLGIRALPGDPALALAGKIGRQQRSRPSGMNMGSINRSLFSSGSMLCNCCTVILGSRSVRDLALPRC